MIRGLTRRFTSTLVASVDTKVAAVSESAVQQTTRTELKIAKKDSVSVSAVESLRKKHPVVGSVKEIRLELPVFNGIQTAEAAKNPLEYQQSLNEHRVKVQESMKRTLATLIANNQPAREWIRGNRLHNGSMLPHEHYTHLPHGMGCLFVVANRNNTIMTLTDWTYKPLRIITGGLCGLKGHHRGTPEAGTRVGMAIADVALEKGFRDVAVVLKGFGPGRESAFRSIVSSGLRVKRIEDQTPIRHGGTRPKKARRV